MVTVAYTPMPGLTIGSYSIEELLGEGAMARVFRATQHGAGGFRKQVALKMVRGRGAEDPETVEYFINEARIGGYLRHPNIVEIYGFSEEEGALCLAMEYINGVTATSLLRGLKRRDEQLPVAVSARIVSDTLAALSYAHTARDEAGAPLKIVHRDLKPSNVLIGYDGSVKISDFGVARSLSNMNRTVGSTTKGTPAFMSPEQALGDELDARSDLFSISSLLYSLLAGRSPFQAKTLFDTMQRIVFVRTEAAMDQVWDSWPELVPFFQRGWQQERDLRFPDAVSMRSELMEAVPDLRDADVASVVSHSGHTAAHLAIVDDGLDGESDERVSVVTRRPTPCPTPVPGPTEDTILSQPSMAQVRVSQPLRVALPAVPSDLPNPSSGYAIVSESPVETVSLPGIPSSGASDGKRGRKKRGLKGFFSGKGIEETEL